MDTRALLQRLMNFVGVGRVNLVDDDKGTQRMQATLATAHTADDLPRLAEYGFQSNPPAGSDVLVLWFGGAYSDGAVVATGNQQHRIKGLAPGEVALSDDKGQRIYLSAGGIVIDAGGLPVRIVSSAGLQIEANVTITGNVTIAGQVMANGKRIDETHTHTGVSSGPSTTGPVA